MVNKARLVESMANLVKDKRIDGITNIQDHSSREGMQIVVDVRRDANAQVILNQLFTYSQLEDTISMIHIALVPGAGGKLQPRVLTLRQILDQYIGFQKDVVERRTRFDLKKARDRAHILEGLKVATDNIDRIIAIIRASKNEAEAKENLMAEPFWIDQIALLGIVDGSEHFEFHLDEPQAQAIVDMRLGRLSGLEQEKINDEYKDLESRIAGFEEILSCDANILAVVKQELQEIKQICSRITIIRRGETMGVHDVSQVSEQDISRLMVGRDVVLNVERKRLIGAASGENQGSGSDQ